MTIYPGRRTPGLRREEVAQLAGVSTTWYTWLEQGRDIKVSSIVLDCISTALQLNKDEADYLYNLALESKLEITNPKKEQLDLNPSLKRILAELNIVQQSLPIDIVILWAGIKLLLMYFWTLNTYRIMKEI